MNLILAATDMEIEYFRKIFNHKNDILCYRIGIGIINSLYSTINILNSLNCNIRRIMLVGIGGGFENKVKLLDTCIASSEILGDFGICYDTYIQPFDNYKIDVNFKKKSIIEKYNIIEGNFITVNCVSTNKKRIEFFQKKYSPVCENMEGFSLAYLCKKKKIDFIEIRTISNIVGDRENWKIKESIEKLNEIGEKFIKEIL